MMMKRKRMLASLTAAGMCLSYLFFAPVMMPEAVLTASAAETSGTCGDNLTWELENGTLTISGTGEMHTYLELGVSQTLHHCTKHFSEHNRNSRRCFFHIGGWFMEKKLR